MILRVMSAFGPFVGEQRRERMPRRTRLVVVKAGMLERLLPIPSLVLDVSASTLLRRVKLATFLSAKGYRQQLREFTFRYMRASAA